MRNILGPLEPNLEVVVLGDVLEEVRERVVRLVLGELDDALREALVDEEALPARNGVRADDGVDGLELGTDVGGVAADAFTEGVAEPEDVEGERVMVRKGGVG